MEKSIDVVSPSLIVFVCGTRRDLAAERAGVLDAIQKLRLQHDSMEFFGAHSNAPIETCLAEVRRSDVLVFIVGHLYGSLVPDSRISFSQAEYQEGWHLRKPCLVYMRHEDVPVLPKHMEQDPEKLKLLKDLQTILLERHMVARFRDAQELSVQVAADLSRTAQELKDAVSANVEGHLALFRQGVDVWNAWRVNNPKVSPDLSGGDFRGVDLRGADLHEADLTDADLRGTELLWTNLTGANVRGANLEGAVVAETIFANVDLTGAKGLDACAHGGPSTIDLRTFMRSGTLPLAFLRGCNIPDRLIEQLPFLLEKPIEFYSCFISHSSTDTDLAQRLHADLQNKGVRCWFAPEDMMIGDRIPTRIDEVVRLHDKLLLILSENSISSDWVEKEVETAFEKERERKTTVLFPIRLDDTVMHSKVGWAANIKRSRHIGDFTHWKDHDAYQKAFERLLEDLKAKTGG